MIGADRYIWTEGQVGESEAFLTRVVETSADGLIIVGTDERIAFVNPAVEQLLNLPRHQLAGQPYADFAAKLLTLQGDPLPIEEWPTTRVFQTGQAVYELEASFERGDGNRIVLSANAGPMVGPDGATAGVVISFRDATARQAAEDTLRNQAARLRAQAELLDLAHDAIFVRDTATGRIVYWNHAAGEVYGYGRDEAVGRVSHELLQTRFPEPLAAIEETMIREGSWEGQLVHRTRDGREVIIETRWTLQQDPRGKPIAFLEINRDVTARKQAEAELAQRLEDLAQANREISRGHREMTAINRSMTAVSRALDLPELLQNIVDAARELIGARYAALGVADNYGHITQFITSGITPEQRGAIGPLPQGHGLLGALISEATPMRAANIAADPRSHGLPPNHPPMKSLLGVPILSRGRAVGDLYLTDKIGADEFGEEDQNLLTILAGHAAVAIENAQLYADVLAARDQLRSWNRDLESVVAERTREIERISREMTARVLQAQEVERGRIARELHDETAQSLTRLLIDLDLVKPSLAENGPAISAIARVEQGLKRALDEVRALSHDLRPAILEDFGLAAALRAYAEDWMRTFGLPIQLDLGVGPEDRLPSEMEIALFRIAQEALMNAGKYAGASSVALSLSFVDGGVELIVQDNGTGFDPAELDAPNRRGGLGLYSMRERAALLGGELAVESEPGEGTRVRLLAPLPGPFI